MEERKLKRLLMICSTVLLVGCAAGYDQHQIIGPETSLDREAGVLISIPEDGVYGGDVYSASGRMTSNAIRAAFQKMGVSTTVVEDCHGSECLAREDIASYGYYVMPEILHWEERATEWSGKPDRIEIQIAVYDASSGEELAKASYKGKSQWATFGGDHPQDLLPEPTNAYVQSLYE